MQIDRTLHIPLYIQLKNLIVEEIENQVWVSGSLIPSEKELQEHYDVSRITVRQAVNELVNEGLVIKKQGKGTYVSFPKLSHNLPNLTSFTEDIRSKGLVPQAVILKVEKGNYPEISKKMGLLKNSMLLNIKRLRLINGEEVGIHDSYINLSVIKNSPIASTESFDYTKSIYDAIEKEGMIISHADETLEGGIANEETAELLGVKRGFPLLILERITFNSDEVPVEYVFMNYRADKYKYSVRLHRN